MWVQVAIAVVMMIVSTAIQMAIAERPKPPVSGNLDVPTAKEGDSIIIVFGTVRLKAPNVLWYGNARSRPIKSSGGKK